MPEDRVNEDAPPIKRQKVAEFCKKHYQPILDIEQGDFQDSCMRCLREAFLKMSGKGNQDSIKLQISKDVKNISDDFLEVMKEYHITDNIKKDFCEFTS